MQGRTVVSIRSNRPIKLFLFVPASVMTRSQRIIASTSGVWSVARVMVIPQGEGCGASPGPLPMARPAGASLLQLPARPALRPDELLRIGDIRDLEIRAIPAQGLPRAERDVPQQECLGDPCGELEVRAGRGLAPLAGVEPLPLV